MLAQWLIRYNPLVWRHSEEAKATRLVVVYCLGFAAGIVSAAVIGDALGASPPLLWFTAGWLTWCGLVALTTWHVMRRMDRLGGPDRPGRDDVKSPAGPLARRQLDLSTSEAADDQGDSLAFRHYPPGSSVGIPYQRNPAYDRAAENDTLIPETPEYGFFRDRDGRERHA